MKFTVKHVMKQSARIGELSHIKADFGIKMETPLVLLHTQAGHIPHITHEVLKLISKEPQILQIPLVSIHNYYDAIQEYDGRISEFVGSKDAISYITLNDPSNLTRQGHHVKEMVPIFTKNGKVLYDSQKYMAMINNLKPDMYTLLSDGDTNIASSQKRITKSVENTAAFNKQCISYQKKSSNLQDSFVIAPVVGGYCLKSREKFIELILQNDSFVHGYLIDGLHNNGPEVEFIPFNEVELVVKKVIDNLPESKLRVISGCWSPVNIIKLVKCGIDVFDTSYCRILTERSAALTFSINENDLSEAYEINLRHNQYAEDFKPLLLGCQCITCNGYSRGYIHHLLTVQELLGSVLIMIHNVHHILRFFSKIRQSIRDECLVDLENNILDQYNEFQCQKIKNLENENK